MPEINLLKNELQEKGPFSFGKTGLVSLYAVLGILGFEMLLYLGLAIYQNRLEKNIARVEQQGIAVNAETGKIEKDRLKALSLQRSVNNLEVLLDNHIFWTPVFQELEKYTYKQARYDTLQVQYGDSKLIISGVIPSYTDLGKLILGLRKSQNVRDVTLQGTALSEGGEAGYTFNMEVFFDPRLFLK